MTIDTAAILGQLHLQHVDLTSAAIGAAVARSAEAAIIKTVRTLPGMLVARLRKHVQALAAAGKIDAPTMKLLASYARATFAWVDEELPDAAGSAKMTAALDQLAAIPYLGVLIRADRAGAQAILQAAYDAIDAEAKAQAQDAPGGKSDAAKDSQPAGGAQQVPAAPPPQK